MKKIVVIFCILIFAGCSMGSSNITILKKVQLNDSFRDPIGGLINPTVSYVLNKDGEVYLNKSDVDILEDEGGNYTLSFNLLSGSSYTFSEFTIKNEDSTLYVLDTDLEENIIGFSISIDGVFSTLPKIFLKKVTGVVFDPLDYESFAVDIVLDESSILEPVDLTFEVSSNIPNATFKIYKYTIYWVSGPELNQNEIFDMDTGLKFDPLVEGDDDPWGSGKFKIETTNSLGDTIFVVGFSEEWSKKHIHLILD